MLEGSRILVTGGTGSFGQAFTNYVLSQYDSVKLLVFSRDEMKQWEMAKKHENDRRVRFFVGDVRDRDRLFRAVDGVDYVVHAAATKIVPTAEYNPFEAVKTNVLGAMNLIDACIERGVKKVVALSTDKASSPSNLYGATKLVSDKMVLAANSYVGSHDTRFCAVRYGNVMGSRGSVIPLFLERARQGQPLQITDRLMTRFMITLQEGIDLVVKALETSQGNEILVKKIASMGILDIAEAVDPGGMREITGRRPGEKLHEQMISVEDAYTTLEFTDHYRIVGAFGPSSWDSLLAQGGRPVPEGFTYTSDTNPERMSVEELRAWISANRELVGGV
jgi:UDP-N-acetylglucosamine 4,6-dehydratase/5-epimerase